jgi:hypothetical protein
MAIHVHSVMENAQHLYVTIDRTIEFHMATNTEIGGQGGDYWLVCAVVREPPRSLP